MLSSSVYSEIRWIKQIKSSDSKMVLQHVFIIFQHVFEEKTLYNFGVYCYMICTENWLDS